MAERRKSTKKVAENRKMGKNSAENRKEEVCRKPENDIFESRKTKILGPNQDVLTQKEFFPGGATNSKTRALLEH